MTKEGSSKHFGKFEFWDDRYEKNQDTFDWYQKYPCLRDIFTQYIKKSDIILNVGAGNSCKFNFHFKNMDHARFPIRFHNASNDLIRSQRRYV